jgi:hypothetical protein
MAIFGGQCLYYVLLTKAIHIKSFYAQAMAYIFLINLAKVFFHLGLMSRDGSGLGFSLKKDVSPTVFVIW